MELVDTPDSSSGAPWACGFESRLAYMDKTTEKISQWLLNHFEKRKFANNDVWARRPIIEVIEDSCDCMLHYGNEVGICLHCWVYHGYVYEEPEFHHHLCMTDSCYLPQCLGRSEFN